MDCSAVTRNKHAPESTEGAARGSELGGGGGCAEPGGKGWAGWRTRFNNHTMAERIETHLLSFRVHKTINASS